MTEFTPKEIVLIDDDALVTLTWKAAAKKKGVSLHVFSNAEEFLAQIAVFPTSAHVYVDANLGAGASGLDVAGQLLSRGFQNVWLATGYDAESLQPPSGLKGIVGKDPPF